MAPPPNHLIYTGKEGYKRYVNKSLFIFFFSSNDIPDNLEKP